MSSNSPIIVTICGETTDEIRAKLVKLAREFGYVPEQAELTLALPNHSAPAVDPAPNPVPVVAADEPKTVEAPKEEKKGRGRPPKAKEAAETAAPAPAAAPAETPQTSVPPTNALTQELVMEKMQAILNSGPDKNLNLGKLKVILSKFGAQKFSDLKKENYAEFVAECDKKLAA